MLETNFSTFLAIIVLAAGSAVTFAQQSTADAVIPDTIADVENEPESAQPSFTQGEAQTGISTLFDWKGASHRDSAKCSTEDVADGTSWFAAHWPMPRNWAAADFDDRDWPKAVTFTNDFVGVKNKPAYTNFTELFDDPAADAKFIWSSSLVHDNLVLMRTRVK